MKASGLIDARLAAQCQPARGTRQCVAPTPILRYLGFDQTGTIRAYRFKRISRGEQTREFIVNADMGLFATHHVGIQEGPALASRLLSAGGDASVPGLWPSSQSLSEQDLLAHLARQPEVGPMRNRKRKLNLQAPRPVERVESV